MAVICLFLTKTRNSISGRMSNHSRTIRSKGSDLT
jgi:hypothetical protein